MLPSEYLAQGWCQHTNARSMGGEHTPARNPNAVKWCFKGAVYAAGADPSSYLDKALELQNLSAEPGLQGIRVANWNDRPLRTQTEVVALAWRVEIALGLRPGAETEIELRCLAQVEPALELALVN